MRQLIVIDPNELNEIQNVLALTEPKVGEEIILTREMNVKGFATGVITKVRTNPKWPTTFLYDAELVPTNCDQRGCYFNDTDECILTECV